MAIIYELRTFSDFFTAIMEELKYQSSDTVSKNRIKRDLNIIYLNEIVPADQWKWLQSHVELTHSPKITAGTISVTLDSVAITFSSAPIISVEGYYFSISGQSEIYKIDKHVANSISAVLETPFTGPTSASSSYTIWTNKLLLPNNCRDTFQVIQDFKGEPLDNMGLQEFRRAQSLLPKEEGKPRLYTTLSKVDPVPYTAIGGLPALSTRSSNGFVKTLIFNSSVASLLTSGDRIEVSLAGHYSYNGRITVSTVSTTTITYTGLVNYNESAVADGSLTLKSLSQETEAEAIKELWIHPSVTDIRVTLHVDYIKECVPLINDTDEPLIPIADRSSLLYGALSRAWSRERNPEEASRNATMYQAKLTEMIGKLDDSTDFPLLVPSKSYLAMKRRSQRNFGYYSQLWKIT